jgi:hAT family C-terminal dimerisation region
MLLTGNLDETVTRLYPELACDGRSFQTQLDMFHSLPGMTTTETAPTLNACCDVLKNMVPAMRALFPHVEALIRLLLVNPASSATAERSLSGLRRLKTYSRSTCGQRRLNNLAIRHVHKHIMDGVNVPQLIREFFEVKDIRSQTLGHIRDAHFV